MALSVTLLPETPPAIRTVPSGSKELVVDQRLVLMDAVVVQLPVCGSYKSALVRETFPTEPPAIRTFPFGNKDATCPSRPVVLEELVKVQVPATESKSSPAAELAAPPSTNTFSFGSNVA